MTSNSNDGEINTETLGSIFRTARCARQISIEDAAEATRIHIRFIRGLEDDNYIQMPAEVFVRGFIKLYSVFLGLDPDETLSRYIRQDNATPKKPAEKPYRQKVLIGEKYVGSPVYKQSIKKITIAAIALILLVGIMVIGSLMMEITDQNKAFQTSSQIKQPDRSSTDTSIQETMKSAGPEIVVDRPPAITVEEEVVPQESATVSGGSEPEENTRILENRLYKITKEKKIVNNTTSNTSGDDDTSRDTIQESEPPSPEPPIEESNASRSIETAIDTVTETAPSEVEEEFPPVEQGKNDGPDVENAGNSDPVEAPVEQVAANGQEQAAAEVLTTVAVGGEQGQTQVPEGALPTSPKNGNVPSPIDKPGAVSTLTAEPGTETSEVENSADPTPEAKYLLKATFIEHTWIRIQVDNKKPRQYTYKPGVTRTWKADHSIYLHLGSGGGVNLSLNGKSLPTGATSGKVAQIRIPDDIR